MTFIKICGITNPADAHASIEAGANALGFNFYRRSPRYIEPEKAREIIERLPATVLCVGVFVNEAEPREVARVADVAGVGAVQLHGDESPDYCRALQERYVIKALRAGADFEPVRAMEYETQAIMLDAFSATTYGGTGRTVDWSLARRVRELTSKLFLAGGLSPENVAAAIAAVTPYAVDACSSLESAPGRKDEERVRAFISAVRGVEC
ncbi:MAG TPA: phosphoribosylanthranilate isomerase [Pyrinomonadaceae bacterium]